MADIDRASATVLPSEEGRWSYVMVNPVRVESVWEEIRALDGRDRPLLVRDAFMQVLLHLAWNNGEVELHRRELAKLLGCSPSHLTEVMSVLERLGVVRKDRMTGAGVRGGRMVTYRCNPELVWRGDLQARVAVSVEFDLPQSKVIAFPSKGQRDRERSASS